MAANWTFYSSSDAQPSRSPHSSAHDSKFGSAAAAKYERNSSYVNSADNGIHRLSAKAESPTKTADELAATLTISDEDSDESGSVRLRYVFPEGSARHRKPPPPAPPSYISNALSKEPRVIHAYEPELRRKPRAPPPPQSHVVNEHSGFSDSHRSRVERTESHNSSPHVNESRNSSSHVILAYEAPRITDPYEPSPNTIPGGSHPLAERIATRSSQLSSPYVYRDNSPQVRKLVYKRMRGQAPDPPPATLEEACQPPSPTSTRSGGETRGALRNSVYQREEKKRPAPQPPNHTSIYEDDFWLAVEEEASRPLSSVRGVEAKVRKKRKNDRKHSTNSWGANSNKSGYGGDVNLTFREKMMRFFGLTGQWKKKRQRSAMTIGSTSHRDIQFSSAPRTSMQNFSFANSKAYKYRPDLHDIGISPDHGAGQSRVIKHSEPVTLPQNHSPPNPHDELSTGPQEYIQY